MDQTVSQAFAAVPDPILFESDISLIAQAMLVGFQAGYEAATGVPLSLGAADPRRYSCLYQADLISQSYAAGNWVSKQNLLKYAVSNNLDTLGSFWGDMGRRLQPSSAQTEIVFTIAAASGVDITIPLGTSCATTDGSLVYATLSDCVISAGSLFAAALAQCTTPGALGNSPALNSITVLQNWNSPYVVSCYNSTLASGGADLETDDHYRVRLYKLPKGLSTCGTRESYEFYALSANPSIAQVSVYSNPGIAGTVILTPLMSGGGVPTSVELSQVSMTADIKSSLVMSACYDNAHLGTPASVAKLVNLVFGHAVLEKWWAYGGKPYHFRIRTTDPVTNPNRIAILNRAILATKPASRWPDPIARTRNVGNDICYMGGALFRIRVRRVGRADAG